MVVLLPGYHTVLWGSHKASYVVTNVCTHKQGHVMCRWIVTWTGFIKRRHKSLVWTAGTLICECDVGMGICASSRKEEGRWSLWTYWETGRRFSPRNGLSSSGSGSSITCAGPGSTPQKSANGANENENNIFLWIITGTRRSFEGSVSVSHFGSIDEIWDLTYRTPLPPNAVFCPAAKVS